MRSSQIAVNLSMLRGSLRTPAEIATSLGKVRRLGYEAVQVSGLGPIPDRELRAILEGEGLVCCATHETPGAILNETEWVSERLLRLGCRYTVYPWPEGCDLGDLREIAVLAGRLNRAGLKLRRAGQVLAYHNHAVEMAKVEGRTVLEWIYGTSGTKSVQGELDPYWIQHGGCDPILWCRKLRRRLPLVHLKDYAVIGGAPRFAPLGEGNLNIPAIVRAANASGCEWFIVGQEECYGADPFECLGRSLTYLKTLARDGDQTPAGGGTMDLAC